MEFDRMTPDERGALNRYVNMLKGYISPMLHERAIIAANAELVRFREKLDREKMAKVIYKASNDFQSDESIQFGRYWKDKWPGYISDVLIKYLTE